MRARVVNDDKVAVLNFWKRALDRELVAVFAKASDNVVDFRFGRGLFSADRDLVVGAVHAGPHKVGHASVNADVFSVSVFFVNRLCDKPAVRAGYRAAAFPLDFQAVKVRWNDHAVVERADFFGHLEQVHFLLAGLVRDSDSAAQVKEFDFDSKLFLKFHRKLKKHFGGVGKVIGIKLV